MTEENKLFVCGHTACAGCGQAIGARLVVDAAGPNVIIANATGCLEIFSSKYGESSWNVPWIHSLFENTAAIGAGIESALRYLGKIDRVRVIAQGGDGGTADIGLQALSGMWERGQDVLYVCYDNEAYMNTGVQRSGLTPPGSNTTTSPPGRRSTGNPILKKNMIDIALAHGIPYVATASVGYPMDVQKKVKKALTIRGPKYMQIFVPCPLGWRHLASETPLVGKLVVETGLYPIVEYEGGELKSVMKIRKIKAVTDYLKLQGRFKHLLGNEEGKKELERIGEIAAANIARYGIEAVGSSEPVATV
jgi:pyruvate ferredoxin oxidoreductase beta subunit